MGPRDIDRRHGDAAAWQLTMRKIILCAILVVPGVTLAAPHTFSELADLLTNLINGGIGVALILGIVVYFFGVATSISKIGEGDAERLRAHFLWGIIALFVMFSVWGILALVRNTLFGGGAFGGDAPKQATCETIDDCIINE